MSRYFAWSGSRFYGHFSSKEDLIAEASDRALMGSLALFTKVAERSPADPLSAIASGYLTSRHRDRFSRTFEASRGLFV
jgi:TetR/AcrR family transcriptional repressor of nem operon